MLDSFLIAECVHPIQFTLGALTTAVSEVSDAEVVFTAETTAVLTI